MRFQTRLVRFIAHVAPWLAPIPTAYVIAVAAIDLMGLAPWAAWTLAASLETVGVSASVLLLDLRSYNASKRKTDPAAPVAWAWIILGGYFVSAVFLTVVLHVIPSAAIVAPALLPLLSMSAVGTLAMWQDHDRRLRGVAESKDEARRERQLRKDARIATKPAKVAIPAKSRNSADWRKLPPEDRQLIAEMSTAEIVTAYAVKERTARNWAAAAKNGNGNGKVEVME